MVNLKPKMKIDSETSSLVRTSKWALSRPRQNFEIWYGLQLANPPQRSQNQNNGQDGNRGYPTRVSAGTSHPNDNQRQDQRKGDGQGIGAHMNVGPLGVDMNMNVSVHVSFPLES
jgi:hypothetical protein